MYNTNISVLIENRNKNILLIWDDHNARIFSEKALDETAPILNMKILWDYIFVVQSERITVLSWKDLIPFAIFRTTVQSNKNSINERGLFAVS